MISTARSQCAALFRTEKTNKCEGTAMNRKLMYQYAEIVSSNTVDICVDERALQDHG
jgi:hypothetical protein